MKNKNTPEIDDLMATVVIGERGQIVIPKEIRDKMDLQQGSRLVLMRHHGDGPLLLFPIEHLRTFMQKMTTKFSKLDVS